MTITDIVASTCDLSAPPAGSINILRGDAVTGPGGRWIPCATLTPSGTYVSGLFQVAPGSRQLCANHGRSVTADEALSHAVKMARSAAA
jgi:hypothetical protein